REAGGGHGRFSPKASLSPTSLSFSPKAAVSPRVSPRQECWGESVASPEGWGGDHEERPSSPSRILRCESDREQEGARMLSPPGRGENLRQGVLDNAPARLSVSPNVSPRRRA
ncbi:unnamed protein product, partial [Laminaria digitata]